MGTFLSSFATSFYLLPASCFLLFLFLLVPLFPVCVLPVPVYARVLYEVLRVSSCECVGEGVHQ